MGLAGSLDSTEINSVEISEECQSCPQLFMQLGQERKQL